ncbi:aminoacyl-histidine dipeptidase [Flavobacterium sp. CS20]|uniref:aminoacyl-histidine dipeptidase n=1 Tax=Flavobacterium sp. CS20 TaxID=2775246 RepID=UPI001B3A423C|nr:aminoacyl-histidine dipeptidase [Flavobacterium sp. CS20]QTY28353.1 aminoacyl-histidine dipeptidase [Flavobacterium sp. CS20]
MKTMLQNIEPKIIWKHFSQLNAVPRPSKKEERVIQFMMDFGQDLGLETLKDKAGNVIIKKPATKGHENKKAVVLQSHLDMVHQKNEDTDFDFSTQGIEMYVDGDWVKAKGTTLGADNGLGVAAIMSILASDDIEHPALEALFTIDEETGMTGAKNLDPNILNGEILLNLDTEEDDEIGIGCAGGVDITATRFYIEESIPDNTSAFQIVVKGLQGGHSGMDIIKGLANANKILTRLLFHTHKNYNMRLSTFVGGGLRNAIPRESKATFVILNQDVDALKTSFQNLVKDIQSEYQSLEPQMSIQLESCDKPKSVLSSDVQDLIIKSLQTAHNGVYRMSPDIEGLVETSNNLAKVHIEKGKIEISCLTRSSVDSGKWDLAHSLESAFDLAGCQVKFSGDYPGWTPNPNSEILKVIDKLYQKQFGNKANIATCHAGLECGILGSHYPEMDMVSFGPTIKGAHSPDERASISSTQKFWAFLKDILKNIPEKS